MDLKEFQPQVLEVQTLFEQKKWTLGFCESCTGGLLSAAVVAQSGVSSFYKGAVVSYAGSVKESVLHVPSGVIQSEGEVSLPVVQAMALGVKKVLNVDWCLSVSGVAGPGGGSAEKPVGTVCFGLLGPHFERQEKRIFSAPVGALQREDIQRQSVIFAFDFLLSAVR